MITKQFCKCFFEKRILSVVCECLACIHETRKPFWTPPQVAWSLNPCTATKPPQTKVNPFELVHTLHTKLQFFVFHCPSCKTSISHSLLARTPTKMEQSLNVTFIFAPPVFPMQKIHYKISMCSFSKVPKNGQTIKYKKTCI